MPKNKRIRKILQFLCGMFGGHVKDSGINPKSVMGLIDNKITQKEDVQIKNKEVMMSGELVTYLPKLKFHDRRCNNCRYYRIWGSMSHCLLLGRSLSQLCGHNDDMYRYCEGWKKRPKTWNVLCEKNENPFWKDKYITRKTQDNIRKRAKINTKKGGYDGREKKDNT
jgi:hypothetical protein